MYVLFESQQKVEKVSLFCLPARLLLSLHLTDTHFLSRQCIVDVSVTAISPVSCFMTFPLNSSIIMI